MNPIMIRIVAVLVIFAAGLGVGWRVKAAFVAERDLAIKEASEKFQTDYRDSESKQARILEDTLKRLKANERVIEREKEKIVDRPVYKSECLDADGLQLVDRTRRSGANPAKPADQVRTAE